MHKQNSCKAAITPDRAVLRMIGAGELFLTKISESECLQACESCKAAEQAVGIIKVE